MSEVLRKRNKKSRKFDHVNKFGVKKKRWEVENEEIASLEARLQDMESVRCHAVWAILEHLLTVGTVSCKIATHICIRIFS